MPLPRNNKILDYSRWQQNLIGVLQPEIMYDNDVLIETKTILTIDVRLGYRNKGDNENDWKYYAGSLERRDLECVTDNVSTNLNSMVDT